MKSFADILREKVVVFDGAMGTSLQAQNLSADDFGGERTNGCNEYLVLSAPEAVRMVHAEFLEAGCDVIETDTFGGASIVLAEYGLGARSFELNRAAALLARSVADQFTTSSRPRFVAGSIGPTTKLPSLGHVSFAELEESFFVQATGLLEGGADLLCVETCQDLLQLKAALAGVFRCFLESRKKIPVVASVTIESTGTMLLGTEIAAALSAIEPFPVDVIGMNCATGPKEMSENVRYLCSASGKPVFVMPNAGIPENVGGRAHYHLSPEDCAASLSHFVKDLGVSVVGGCCGTTPGHIRLLAQEVGGLAPARRAPSHEPSVSSLYESVSMRVDPAPLLIGERTNANGSKLFRELLAKDDWEGMVAIGKDQVKEGAHVLDVCTAFVGRDERRDMSELIYRMNTQITAPLMIDSTEPPVIEDALRRIGGRAIVNSVNLEDGGERLHRVLSMCRTYGAAVVALTIDEHGMAKTVERKLEIARRLMEIATKEHGLREADIIFDPLTFTLGSGDAEFRSAGIATLEAVKQLKKEFPRAHTSLGVSNISFGLNPPARQALNSVFLHAAVENGLDMAIVHAARILPLYKITPEITEICNALIFNKQIRGQDPLHALMAMYADRKAAPAAAQEATGPVDERLRRRIIDGNKVNMQPDLDEALRHMPALDIINGILLEGMKRVGELFGSGQMQLPFVLQSAEAMKAAVSYLERFMDKSESRAKGTLVIATVKGDVHDIGKNLVDIILTNNGYNVINLGIQCPLERMVAAFEEHHADAIGMSGLLVKSTMIMKENLAVLNERSVFPPVVLGGAALTRRYVEDDLRSLYKGHVSYANDAFDGLRFMERVKSGLVKRGESAPPRTESKESDELEEELSGLEAKIALSATLSPADRPRPPAPAPVPGSPFFGSRVVRDISLREVFGFINEAALIKGQWQVRRGKSAEPEYRSLLERDVYPELERLKNRAEREGILRPAVVYGYFPCRASGDDLVVFGPREPALRETEWTEAEDLEEWVRFRFPRQEQGKFLCLSDFFRNGNDGTFDVVAFQVVTMGPQASEVTRELFRRNEYKEYLYLHGLGVESAEALAEMWHQRVRRELGIGGKDSPEVKKLFSQQYQGSRYSFGYPACPALEDQQKLFELLRPGRIGVSLTEEFQLVPEQSTSALIVHHPEARYFSA